ncbi:MAG TPA: amidase family protein [Vicinamibacterales bacterium]|nr:amidase family protein [Vicinamibacterales bacterium]
MTARVGLAALALIAWTQARGTPPAPPAPTFSVVEATIPDMRRAMEERRVTSRELVVQYLTRIALYEKTINAAVAINPHAIADAEALDADRARGRIRGPLHGIPIAVKDNIQTTDMPTTGGALAFAGFTPPYEATLVTNLKNAGAIVIAKTVLTELANWVAGAPTPMPGNYTAVAGFAFNPYDPRPDPRDANNDGRPVMSTGGSSSGAGTASSFWAANVGTDTSGSVVNPAQLTMLVGIRPTTGRISRWGIIPITADQDTAGPMARTVADAAILLGAVESPSPDPNDATTRRCPAPPQRDYTAHLKRDGLKGARIGIPRAFYYERLTPPGEKTSRGGLNDAQAKLMADAIDAIKREGAIVVDPANLPSVLDPDPAKNILLWETCSGVNQGKGKDANCTSVLKYGMKRDFNAWVKTLGDRAPVKSLTALRLFNLSHTRSNAIRYGQSNLDISDELDVERDKPKYDADRAKDLQLAGDRGLKAALDDNRLDALLFPGWNISGLASRPGFPEIVVPVGFTPGFGGGANNPFPAGFDPKPTPYSAAFVGAACSEPRLIELAYAFEQATKRRVPPPSTP